LKTTQDPGQILFWCFGGSANDRSAHFGSDMLGKRQRTLAKFYFCALAVLPSNALYSETPKFLQTAHDPGQFLIWRFGGSANDRIVQLSPTFGY
jgi:hypothetical protein